MLNTIVANAQNNIDKYSEESFKFLLQAQIENSLVLGWTAEEIIILSNFDFEYLGIKAYNIKLNSACFKGSKLWGAKWIFENIKSDIIWSRDCDTWQNYPFKCPKFRDVGITCYSTEKFNGGSVFWRKSALDIIDEIVDTLTQSNAHREEPILNRILKNDKYKKRVTVINNTFNVGSSGFIKRYLRSDKPVRVCHFHPTNRIAWETQALDRTHVGIVTVSRRLEAILRKYYPDLPMQLKGDFNKKKHKEAERLIRLFEKEVKK